MQDGKIPAVADLGVFEQLRFKGKDKPDQNAKAKFMALFRQMAQLGSVSPKRFAKEMDGFYAFTVEMNKIQLRIVCFQEGNRWLLTHGFQKPGAQRKLGQWPAGEIRRAKNIRAEYLSRKSKLTGIKIWKRR